MASRTPWALVVIGVALGVGSVVSAQTPASITESIDERINRGAAAARAARERAEASLREQTERLSREYAIERSRRAEEEIKRAEERTAELRRESARRREQHEEFLRKTAERNRIIEATAAEWEAERRFQAELRAAEAEIKVEKFHAENRIDEEVARALSYERQRSIIAERWTQLGVIWSACLALALAVLIPFFVALHSKHPARYAILGGAVVGAAMAALGFFGATEGESGAFALPATLGAVAWFAMLYWSTRAET